MWVLRSSRSGVISRFKGVSFRATVRLQFWNQNLVRSRSRRQAKNNDVQSSQTSPGEWGRME